MRVNAGEEPKQALRKKIYLFSKEIWYCDKVVGRKETSCSTSLEGLYTMWTKSIKYCSPAECRRRNSWSGGPNCELPINSRRESNRVALEWAATEEKKHTWNNGCYTELNQVLQFTSLTSWRPEYIVHIYTYISEMPMIDNLFVVTCFMFVPGFVSTFHVFVNNRKFWIRLHQ